MVIIVTLILYTFMVAPRMVSDKRWKDLTVFLFITIAGITIAGLISLGVDLPRVGSLLTSIFEGVYHKLGLKLSS